MFLIIANLELVILMSFSSVWVNFFLLFQLGEYLSLDISLGNHTIFKVFDFIAFLHIMKNPVSCLGQILTEMNVKFPIL